ncbi:MAG: tetratricopeptide repeat protein [Ectothiorhodospiraceae bacterium]|nr:tetratricopeptide repeat protein [Ectothiorhodospiraceae bacterium]
MRSSRGFALLASLLLVGCAGTGSPLPAGETADRPEIIERHAPEPAERDLIYQLLVAEFAGARGQIGPALDAYLLAMDLTDDPRIAARATRLALYSTRDDEGVKAARRWVELDPADISARQALGVLLVRSGQPAEARRQFREVIMRAGDEAGEAVAELGAGIAREQDNEAVLEVLEGLAREFPDLPEAQLILSQSALRAGRPELALQASRPGRRRQPGARELRTMEGQALLELGREDEAVDVFRSLVEQRPDDDELRLYFARVLLQTGRDQQALVHFQRVLEERPNDAGILYATGLLTLEEGHPDLARPYFERLLELGERRNEASFFLGRIAEELGEEREAGTWYRQVEGEYRAQARVRAALMQGRQGNIQAARRSLQELRGDYPEESVRSFLVEGDIVRQAGDHEEAARVYDEGLSRHPGELDLLYGRAIVWAQAGDVERAERDLRAVLAQDPENAHALNALGYTLVDLTDRTTEGYELIRQAYAQLPENPAILDSMGWAYFRMGRNEEALEYLRRAYEAMPDAEVAAHLGEVLWEMGRRDEARQVWREAAAEESEHDVLQETMRRLDSE